MIPAHEHRTLIIRIWAECESIGRIFGHTKRSQRNIRKEHVEMEAYKTHS